MKLIDWCDFLLACGWYNSGLKLIFKLIIIIVIIVMWSVVVLKKVIQLVMFGYRRAIFGR